MWLQWSQSYIHRITESRTSGVIMTAIDTALSIACAARTVIEPTSRCLYLSTGLCVFVVPSCTYGLLRSTFFFQWAFLFMSWVRITMGWRDYSRSAYTQLDPFTFLCVCLFVFYSIRECEASLLIKDSLVSHSVLRCPNIYYADPGILFVLIFLNYISWMCSSLLIPWASLLHIYIWYE